MKKIRNPKRVRNVDVVRIIDETGLSDYPKNIADI